MDTLGFVGFCVLIFIFGFCCGGLFENRRMQNIIDEYWPKVILVAIIFGTAPALASPPTCGHYQQTYQTYVPSYVNQTVFFSVGSDVQQAAVAAHANKPLMDKLDRLQNELATLKAANGQTTQSLGEQTVLTEGQTLYVSNCARCHNIKSAEHTTNGAPIFFSPEYVPYKLNREQFGVISGALNPKHPSMPKGVVEDAGMRLPDNDAAKITAFCNSIATAPATKPITDWTIGGTPGPLPSPLGDTSVYRAPQPTPAANPPAEAMQQAPPKPVRSVIKPQAGNDPFGIDALEEKARLKRIDRMEADDQARGVLDEDRKKFWADVRAGKPLQSVKKAVGK